MGRGNQRLCGHECREKCIIEVGMAIHLKIMLLLWIVWYWDLSSLYMLWVLSSF